jgi:hypothetical protein
MGLSWQQGPLATGALPDGLCAACSRAYQRSDASLEEFVAAGPVRKRRIGV